MCLVVSVVVAVVSATAIVLYLRDVLLRIFVTVIFVRIFVLCCVFFLMLLLL